MGTRVTVGTIGGTRTTGGYDLAVTDFLTDARIRSARPQRRPYKLRDGAGLYLLITPADARLWRLRYKVHGRESMLALGTRQRLQYVRGDRARVAREAAVRAEDTEEGGVDLRRSSVPVHRIASSFRT